MMQTSRAQGMHTLETSIKELIGAGVISKEAAATIFTGEDDAEWLRFKYSGRDRAGKSKV